MSGEKQQPPQQEPLKCPRCESLDTKFCYYNNYSTTQPRHFCKNCKRYWTAGGSLRNVPVGGGLRKNKKSSSSSSKIHGHSTKQSNDNITSSSSADELINFHGRSHHSVSSSSSQLQQQQHLFSSSNGLAGFPYDESQILAHHHHQQQHHLLLPPASSAIPLASPSSSADDDSLAKASGTAIFSSSSYSNPANNFRYFDTAAESYYGAHYNNSHAVPLPQNPDFYPIYDHSLGANNGLAHHHQLQQQQPAIYGSSKRYRGMAEAASQGGSRNGEVAEIAAQEDAGTNGIYGGGLYQRYGGQQQLLHLAAMGDQSWDPSFSAHPGVASDVLQSDHHPQSTASRHVPLSVASSEQENKIRSRAANGEDEEEDLGNVVNVRYPYDWDQVSEVLFGGTQDFFQMPGF